MSENIENIENIQKFAWTNPKERDFLSNKNEYTQYLEHFKTSQSLPRQLIILDVGANNGHFSIECAKQLPNATIYAFEPFKEPFKCLEQNAKTLPNPSQIVPIQLAIMERTGPLQGTYLPNYSLLSGFHAASEFESDKTMLQEIAGKSLDHEFLATHEQVDSIRLDEWLEGIEGIEGIECIESIDASHRKIRIDLLKIDVEKSEFSVLKSLGQFVKNVYAILVEVHEENKTSVLDYLETNGFTMTISKPTPPTFCLDQEVPATYDARLNTYMVWAVR